MHISSSYAKILGQTNFYTREFPRSGSKAKDGERERKEERLNAWRTQARMAQASRLGQKKKEYEKKYKFSLKITTLGPHQTHH